MSDPQGNTGEPISGNLAACAFVERSHLLRRVERSHLEQLYATGRLFRFQPQQVIIREGEPDKELYLLQDGEVRVTTSTPGGLVELDRLGRGAFFGEVALLTGQPRTATVVAATEVTAIALAADAMEEILRQYPKVRKMLQAIMEARVKRTIERAQQKSS